MFSTALLTYSIITANDVDDVFITMNNQQTAEAVSFLHWPMTRKQAENWCQKSAQGFQNKSDYMFLAHDNDTPAGYIGLHSQNDKPECAEIGYWVSETYKGQGLATEMAQGIVDFAFNDLGFEELFSTTAQDNPASEKVLTKAGFVESGTKDVPLPDGSMRSSRLFKLQKS